MLAGTAYAELVESSATCLSASHLAHGRAAEGVAVRNAGDVEHDNVQTQHETNGSAQDVRPGCAT
jgi:hypothetical protein